MIRYESMIPSILGSGARGVCLYGCQEGQKGIRSLGLFFPSLSMLQRSDLLGDVESNADPTIETARRKISRK